MSSDLSNIFKNELSNTLEQLLSKSTQIDSTSKLVENYSSTRLVECDAKFDFKGITTHIFFYVPTLSATKFEYFMLGGMGDLKEHIDDEITDAINEIIANICGSFCTSVNAQSLPDIGSIKSEIKSTTIIDGGTLSSKSNVFELVASLDGEKLPVLVQFDEIITSYFSSITGVVSDTKENNAMAIPKNNSQIAPAISSIPTPKNLELLYGVKLKLSVRLGTKIVLLKDILRWDVGEIIELEQMVNEPLEILVNGVKIGEGEAVIVEGKFGLKVKKIGNDELKLTQLGL